MCWTLTIAGKSGELIRGHDRPPAGVRFAGYVDDLAALYATTRVVCCPILSGGGTRIKIIEGALQQRPIVATTIGAEGLELKAADGEIAIADDEAGFADAICRLFDDEAHAQQMGARARAGAVARYGEDRVLAALMAHLRQPEFPGFKR